MIIVLTGTSRGVGRSLAEYYVRKGHTVIGCSRSECDLEHENYKHFIVDMSEEKAINAFSNNVRQKFGYIDALINNAGVASMNHFMLTPLDTAKRLMNVNFFGPFSAIRAFVSLLRKSPHPRIVNFSTVAVPFNLDGELAYVASKAAVEKLTKILAKELAVFKITVNAVGPTPIKTDLIAKVPENKIQALLDRQAIRRFGKFEDVYNVIDFYLLPESDFITGQVIYLGGVSK